MVDSSLEASAPRLADLNALRRELEQVVSRLNQSEPMTEQRRVTLEEPTLIIRGK